MHYCILTFLTFLKASPPEKHSPILVFKLEQTLSTSGVVVVEFLAISETYIGRRGAEGVEFPLDAFFFGLLVPH